MDVLECVMFQHPDEWGYRVVRVGNEIIIQNSEDKGKSWRDLDLLDGIKIIVPDKVVDGNPYKDFQLLGVDTSKTINPKLIEAIESGQLLNYEIIDGVEYIKFANFRPKRGLQPGDVWLDQNKILRVTG